MITIFEGTRIEEQSPINRLNPCFLSLIEYNRTEASAGPNAPKKCHRSDMGIRLIPLWVNPIGIVIIHEKKYANTKNQITSF